MALSPAFPARGYSVGDWGPHRTRLAESGEAPTAGREPTRAEPTMDRRPVDLRPTARRSPLETRSQCVATANAPPPQIRLGEVACSLPGVPHRCGPTSRTILINSNHVRVVWAQALPTPPSPRRLNPGPLSDAVAPQSPGFGYCAKV